MPPKLDAKGEYRQKLTVTWNGRKYKIPWEIVRKFPNGPPIWVLKQLAQSKGWPMGPKSKGGRPRYSRPPRPFKIAQPRVYNINLPADQIVKIAKEIAGLMPQVREEAVLNKAKKLIDVEDEKINELQRDLDRMAPRDKEYKAERDGKRGERRGSHEDRPFVLPEEEFRSVHPRIGFIRQPPYFNPPQPPLPPGGLQGHEHVDSVDQLLHEAERVIREAEEENKDTERVLRQDEQRGRGQQPRGTTSNVQLDRIGKKLWPNDFLGAVPRDQITKLPYKVMKPASFIFNTDKDGEPGEHWVAAYIDPIKDQSIEIFDSYGRLAGQDVVDELEWIARKISPQYHLKLKQNRVDFQRQNSNYCGWFSLLFLYKRHKGESFSKATQWDSILDSEQKVKAFQHMLKNKFPEI